MSEARKQTEEGLDTINKGLIEIIRELCLLVPPNEEARSVKQDTIEAVVDLREKKLKSLKEVILSNNEE